jgi:putative transposase
MKRLVPTGPNQAWSMNFVSGALFNDNKFRALTLMDNHTRECRSICAAQNNRGDDVAHLLKHIVSRRDKLTQIQADSGPEFISTALDH